MTDGVANRWGPSGSVEECDEQGGYPTIPTNCTNKAIEAGQAQFSKANVFTVGLYSNLQTSYPLCIPLARSGLQASNNAGYYETFSNADLSDLFVEIAQKINFVANAAQVIDIVADDFNIIPGTVKPTAGTVEITGNQIVWTIGRIGMGEKVYLEYYVEPKVGSCGTLEVNADANLSYTTYNCQSNEMDFPEATADARCFCINGHKSDDSTKPLSGWTITLTNSSPTFVRTDITDGNGLYEFCGLVSGEYNIAEEIRQGWVPIGPSSIKRTLVCDNVTQDFVNRRLNPDIEVTKTVSPASGAPSTNVVFTIEVTNTGGVALNPVVVNDTLPAGLDYVSSNPAGTNVGQDITWNLGSLGPGQSTSIELVAHINGDAFGPLLNEVNTTGVPPTGDNVTDEDDEPVEAICCISGSKIVPKGQSPAGFQVEIKDLEGNSIETTTTDKYGRWAICGLLAGTYNVSEMPRDGWVTDTRVYKINVPGDCSRSDLNFTNTECCIGGKKEVPKGRSPAGFKVKVENQTGKVIAISNTGEDGRWSVCGLLAGTYTVSELPQDGWEIDPNVYEIKIPSECGRSDLNYYNLPQMDGLQYEQFCEAHKISGTGAIDIGISAVDKKVALEYSSGMAGEGDLELDQETAYSQVADKLVKEISSVNDSEDVALNLYQTNKMTYSGDTPLTGGKNLNSRELYGGVGANIQERFSVNEIEQD